MDWCCSKPFSRSAGSVDVTRAGATAGPLAPGFGACAPSHSGRAMTNAATTAAAANTFRNRVRVPRACMVLLLDGGLGASSYLASHRVQSRG